jgi:hypothetical protein
MQTKRNSKISLFFGAKVKKAISELNDPCPCELTPKHKIGEHDACCQICGETHTERICPNKDKPKKDSKTSTPKLESKVAFTNVKPMKLVRCLNPECPFYKKRHRRYFWYSKTTIAKPSCPKCFSHNTEILVGSLGTR